MGEWETEAEEESVDLPVLLVVDVYVTMLGEMEEVEEGVSVGEEERVEDTEEESVR